MTTLVGINVVKSSELKQQFHSMYGCDATAVAVAPGRVNLIGEHTDYNDGFVLPCALEFATKVAFRQREDSTVRVSSLNYGAEQVSFCLDKPLTPGHCQWSNYVAGVYDSFVKKGLKLKGADLLIHGDVPQGAGLSSSAALEVAVGCAINEQNGCGLSPAQIALLGQSAENNFLNCQTGIMDQMIAAKARKDHALLLDCENLSSQQIPVPTDFQLLIVNSNYKRSLVGSEYNRRRQECEEAAAVLGVPSLRHASMRQLHSHQSQLSVNAYRRACHVISENERTLQAAEALSQKDFSRLRQLMYASHDSMRDNFEITVPATDYLVEIVKTSAGDDGAARMTGGGFGGAIVAFLKPHVVDRVVEAILEAYPRETGLAPTIYRCNAGEGMRLM